MTTLEQRQEQLDRAGRHDSHRAELHSLAALGQTDEGYRDAIAKVVQAEEQLAGLQQHIRELEQRADEAATHHASVTAPLQDELAADSTSVARRVELRVSINSANDALESTLAPLRQSIAAARQEAEFVRGRVGVRQAIENAFTAGCPAEQQERVAVLRCASSWLGAPISEWQSRCRALATSVEVAEQKVERHGSRAADLEGARREHRQAREVLAVLQSFTGSCDREIAEIRRKRLEQLYRK